MQSADTKVQSAAAVVKWAVYIDLVIVIYHGSRVLSQLYLMYSFIHTLYFIVGCFECFCSYVLDLFGLLFIGCSSCRIDRNSVIR